MIRTENGTFIIETENTGYYMAKTHGLVETLHYGAKIHMNKSALCEKTDTIYGSDVVYKKEVPVLSLLHMCLELSPTGKGDFRHSALEIELPNGSRVCDFAFVNATVHKGDYVLKSSEEQEKPQNSQQSGTEKSIAKDEESITEPPPLKPTLNPMPFAFGADETLVLEFSTKQGVSVFIYYGVFSACNVITKSVCVKNNTAGTLKIHKCLSYQLDLRNDEKYKLHTFTGAWARERFETRTDLTQGTNTFGSTSGVSSHYCNPFFMVTEQNTTEHCGNAYAFNLIYSGSHFGSVQTGPYSKTRVQAGIQPEGFCKTLENGEEFFSPQAVLSFSNSGKNGVSNNMHEFVKNHIVRGVWQKKARPVLLNNWEGTYFDFNEAKLLKLAKEAKNLGVELFVLDDGWFGERNDDKRGLGDYNVNTKKLPGGLSRIADKIEKMGMKFGLWFEPEMVNADSDLYRAHPDWAVSTPDDVPSESRNQLVLDLCKKQVQDYIIENVNATLKSANISYVKWDMNRPLTDCYSAALSAQGQGSFAHEWVMGLYRVLGEITRQNPDVLFEGCASGGNRFDLGILCYMPQIWTSDCTDAYERTKIQTGTSYGYPQCTMGCHVSASPNHQTARSSPIESRFDIAAFGVLGYELDLTQISSAEKKVMKTQIDYYKEHRDLLQYGKFMRIKSPFDDSESCVWAIVSQDKNEALVLEAIGRLSPNSETLPIRLKGLNADTNYKITVRKQRISVKTFGSLINHVLPVKVNSEGVLMHVAADFYMLDCEEESFFAHGDLLMNAGLRRKQSFTGTGYNENVRLMPDYSARIYHIKSAQSEIDV